MWSSWNSTGHALLLLDMPGQICLWVIARHRFVAISAKAFSVLSPKTMTYALHMCECVKAEELATGSPSLSKMVGLTRA